MEAARLLAEGLGPPPPLPESLQDPEKRAEVMQRINGELVWFADLLFVGSGCLSAAKTIAESTRSGPNTAEERRRLFETIIDPIAAVDRIYAAGVEAAPAFKRRADQPYFFDGVPEGSCVRRYAGE